MLRMGASNYAKAFKDRIGVMSGANILFSGAAFIGTYDAAREEGHGVISSLASAGTDLALSASMGMFPYLFVTGAPALGKIGVDFAYAASQYTRDLQRDSLNVPFASSTFIDSPQIQTMRQAGLALARQSKMKTQEAMLGNEASYMHR